MHAEDYLEYAYLQLGRDAEARGVAETVARVERLDVPNFAGRLRPRGGPDALRRRAREVERSGEARARAGRLPVGEVPLAPRPSSFRAGALGAARSGDLAAARAAPDRLEAIKSEPRQEGRQILVRTGRDPAPRNRLLARPRREEG